MPPTPRRSAARHIKVEHSVSRSAGSEATEPSLFVEGLDPNQSFYPTQRRSNAPPPSEQTIDGEPLLREMRVRQKPVAVVSPPAMDENFSFHTSFQDIGKRLKACNDTLGELQGLGVSHDVPLPELVLVGDQSAGKSSVMSGLANLDLPRSEGTCTRCPLHIRVSRNSDWSCRVSLSKEYKFAPPADREISEADVTDEDPFFPWRKLPTTHVQEFMTVHDKNEIEKVLRWAQVAILNDDMPPQTFVPGSGAIAMNTTINVAADETLAKFSPNVVSLEIKGPELPNLSFYDMPGIFQNPADAKDDYLVNVVRNLSSTYIERPSAIIMCSFPMNSDAENSFTFGLTRKLAATNRTIGVLTKADLLPQEGNHEQWLAIMQGQAHRTGLGYFITSRPQGKDLEDLTRWEEMMFENHTVEQWPSTFRSFSKRCGVENLKEFLSNKLGEEFIKSLPQIEHKVKINLARINRQLATLPELPENVELEVRQSLYKFRDSAADRINEFTQGFSALPNNFRQCLLEIKPKFILKDRTDIPVLEIPDDSSDGDDSTTVNTPSRTGKRPQMAPPTTPAKRHRGATPFANGNTNGNGLVPPKAEDSGRDTPTPSRPKQQAMQPPFVQFVNVGRGFRTLRQVGEEIDAKSNAGMPGIIPARIYEDLALEAIKPWDGPMKVYLEETMRQLHVELDRALAETFASLKKRIVYKEAAQHLGNFLKMQSLETRQATTLIYMDETKRLLTFNDEALTKYRDDEQILLTRFRHRMRLDAKGYGAAKTFEDDWEKMSEAKRREDIKRREEDIQRIGADQFEREVKVIAYVRGYYKLAALRFADAVSQRIICRMIPDIREKLSTYIHEQLGVLAGASRDVYERLMEEHPDVASRREMLKRESEKFNRALASIHSLNTGGDDDVFDSPVAAEELVADEDTQMSEYGV